jgi:WD40 repeat protein/serine/threonine protein kinase
MVTTRWRAATRIFEQAIELLPEQRAAFLDRACDGDGSVRAEVERLLALDASSEDALEPPGREAFERLVLIGELEPGTRVGPWRIDARLGAGGMGVVHLATRADGGFEMRAALKMIRGGSSRDVLERFARERRVLARLEHPSIARLLDGGTTEDGLPYLAMEYVEGRRLDRWCNERRLGVRERVELFASVCRAVHYAHQHLVVHRDLKPQNVLVTPEGVPKLLDFGIAKVLDPLDPKDPSEGAASDALTETAARRLTPRYASPEQIRGEAVTTASDVYSLGVVLFELLTGRGPYLRADSTARELERAICEEDPTRPSRAVAARPRDRDAERIAADRASEPRRLVRALAGDLDTIVLRCLAKDPARRYASAEQLAEDLRRYLERRPVLARPDTWSYRTARFVRRNPVPVAAGTVLVAALLTFLAAARRLVDRAEAARLEAEAASEEARFGHYVAALAAAEAALRARDVEEVQRNLMRAPASYRGWEWRRLREAADASTAVLTGHDAGVEAVAWSPDGSRFATAATDGSILIWSAGGGPLSTLRETGAHVTSLAWSPRGDRLAAVSVDGRLRLLDEAGTELLQLELPGGRLNEVAFASDGDHVAVVDASGKLRVLDASDGAVSLEVEAHAPPASSVAIDPRGARCATGGSDGVVRLWSLDDGRLLTALAGHRGSISDLAFAPDGTELVSGANDRTAILWSIEGAAPRLILQGHTENVRAVAWAPDGRHVATGSTDRTIRITDVEDGACIATLLGHQAQIADLAFAPDGASLLSASEDRSARLWPSRDPQVLFNQLPKQWVYDLAWSPDGTFVAAALGMTLHGPGGQLRVWERSTGAELLRHDVPGRDAKSVAIDPAGRRVAVGGGGGSVTLLDLESGEPSLSVQLYGLVTDLAFDPTGARLAASHGPSGLVVLDAGSGTELLSLSGHTGVVARLDFDPGGAHLASVSLDGTARIWDAASGAELAVLDVGAPLYGVEFAPAGGALAAAAADGSCIVWDTADWTERARLTGHSGHVGGVTALAWSPTGDRLAAAAGDHTLRIWDPASARELATLHGHVYTVYSVAFSPDGVHLASGSGDGSVRLWSSPDPALPSSR